jgi:peptidyl-prolyl cis-trans isomerase C
MQKRLMPIAAAAIAVMTAVPLFAADDDAPDLSQVVATVNGETITLGHIAVAKASLPDQYRNLPSDVLFRGILDQLVSQTLLSQSFEGDRPERIVLALENETRSLIAGEVVENILANAVTPEAVEAMYAEQYLNVEQGQEYSAAHILVETEEAASQVKADIDAGADFAATAREKSTGPSGPRGGDLGWFGKGVMVPAFEAAVVALEPGQVSDPIQTDFGWHVIKLNEIRTATAPGLDAVRGEIEAAVRDKALQDRIADLNSSGDIDRTGADAIDPSVLDQIDLTKRP